MGFDLKLQQNELFPPFSTNISRTLAQCVPIRETLSRVIGLIIHMEFRELWGGLMCGMWSVYAFSTT